MIGPLVRRGFARFALAILAPAVLHAQQGASDAQLPSGREIVDRHVAAIGGRDALSKLSSREVWATFAIPGENVRGTIELFTARPGKRLLRVKQDQGTTVTGFDGQRGWRKDPGKPAVALRGRELAQLRDDAAYDFDLHDPADVAALQNVGIVRWEGRDRYRVRVTSVTGREWHEYFDVANGLFAGSESRRETDKGQVTLRTVVGGYELYDGVRLPSVLRLRSAGVEQVIKVIRVRHNAVQSSVFAPPPGIAVVRGARTGTSA